MVRLIQPRNMADAAWVAYTVDKIHGYVPPELFELDELARLEPDVAVAYAA